jgi:hypothetical protein
MLQGADTVNSSRLAVLSLTLALVAWAPASSSSKPAFDLDTGNAAAEVAIATVMPVIEEVSPGVNDLTIVLQWTSQITVAWFDALAPYHPTAVGIASRLKRQPRDQATTRNMNMAILHASYRVFSSLSPDRTDLWRDMMYRVGLDPDDDSEDPDTPVGIGNAAANALIEARKHDGMNQHGDEGGPAFIRAPYADDTGYRPVNTTHELVDPTRWQPGIVSDGNGTFRVQQFVTPQMRLVRPYSYDSPDRFSTPPPVARRLGADSEAYKRQADELLDLSATLTDEQKLTAETFDNKFLSIGNASLFVASRRGLSLMEAVHQEAMFTVANYDTAIAVWNEKFRHDAVRPFSAIRYLYGDKPVRAWGGPSRGTVGDLAATQWRSYINTADHPEYPSGSAAVCSAEAQTARRMYGSDQLGFSVHFERGSSRVEPGVTPREDTTLTFETWSDLEKQCRESRLLGGVHFREAVEAGSKLGHEVADIAYEFMKSHVDGSAPPPAVPNPKDHAISGTAAP